MHIQQTKYLIIWKKFAICLSEVLIFGHRKVVIRALFLKTIQTSTLNEDWAFIWNDLLFLTKKYFLNGLRKAKEQSLRLRKVLLIHLSCLSRLFVSFVHRHTSVVCDIRCQRNEYFKNSGRAGTISQPIWYFETQELSFRILEREPVRFTVKSLYFH